MIDQICRPHQEKNGLKCSIGELIIPGTPNNQFGETTISYVKIWNDPIETTIYK